MAKKDARRLLTSDDLSRIQLISDPQAQPGGDLIAWVHTSIDDDKDRYLSAIWLGDADGSNARKLTSGVARDTSPRWSPDGSTIAFVSNRQPMLTPPKEEDEKANGEQQKRDKKQKSPKEPDAKAKHPNQVWTIAVGGGEATQVTNHASSASSPTWSPDGRSIAFTASDKPTDDETAPAGKSGVADERIITDMMYRFNGAGFLEKYSHLWSVNLESGEATQLTFGETDASDPQWSPNGDQIAFVGNIRDDRKQYVAFSILAVSADGGDVTQVSPDDARFDAPSWNADGSRIAFSGHLDASVNGYNSRLWTVAPDGSDLVCHTESIDISVGDVGMSDVHASSDERPRWIDTSTIAFLSSQHGESQIWTCDLDGKTVSQVSSGKRRITGFSVTPHGYVYVSGGIAHPFELFSCSRDGTGETRITHANDDFLKEVRLIDAIDLEVTSSDGKQIQGWIIPPATLNQGSPAKHPAIVQIHGGPHAMYAYAMFHEMQLMAAKGYAVIFCNPRGSSGYGQDFTTCTRTRWGESDMPDVIATLETATDAHPWIDPDRLGVTGGSYGGYLTNWIVGHDARFKAAVTQRCVSNFHSFVGTSDIGANFGVYEYGGVPWKDADLLLKYSPISYVEAMTTPLLIIHAEQDLRCPIEQAEQLFFALKYLGRETRMIRIPDESHDLSRSGTPSRRQARLHHLVGWFDSHL